MALAHPGGFVYTPAEYGWWMALQAIVEAADAGHLIDARRMRAGDVLRVPPVEGDVWELEDADGCLYVGESAADALAAAEREAE